MSIEPSNEPMGEVPPQNEIEKLLADLSSKQLLVRRDAAKYAREHDVRDERVIEALKNNAARDSSNRPRKEAIAALKALGIEPPPMDPALAKKRRDFGIGVGLFFGLNLVLWVCGIVSTSILYLPDIPYQISDALGIIMALLPWILNIGLIIYLAFKRPQVALGMLAGFGIALAIVVCLFLIVAAVCFVALGSGSGF